MVNHRYGSIASFLAFGFLAGCGSAADAESTASLTDWLGDTTHFVASGTFQGKPIDIRLMGDAANAAGAYCSRNYAPLPGNVPDADGKYDLNKMYFAMNEVGAIVELDGQMRDISFGHWRHEPTPGTTLTVVPRTFGTPLPAGQTWVDIGIKEPGKIATSGVESAAESGTFTMKLNSNLGATEDTFVSGGGKTGVFISVSWGPQDKMTVSATVDCRNSLMAPWAAALVVP